MIDSITIEDPGFPWFGWYWTGGAIGALLVIALVLWLLSYSASARETTEKIRDVSAIILTIALLAIPLGAGVNGTVSTVLRSNEIHAQKVLKMGELGYINPSFSGDSTKVFTAVKDGEYVLGTITEDPELTWRIVLIDSGAE